MTTEGLSRRRALAGAATAGIGLPLLAACGGGSSVADGAPTDAPVSPGANLGSPADVPVGGGTVYPDQKVVVTQPSAGQFKGFSAICTHQGCLVANVSTTINCPCHGSHFSIEDGSVASGPATRPLSEVTVTVSGGELTIG